MADLEIKQHNISSCRYQENSVKTQLETVVKKLEKQVKSLQQNWHYLHDEYSAFILQIVGWKYSILYLVLKDTDYIDQAVYEVAKWWVSWKHTDLSSQTT